jgi:hypothetical protein
MTSEKIYGPYFFENENGTPSKINCDRYIDMIRNFLAPKIVDKPEILFQQDGATTHTAQRSMEVLNEIFGE